MAAFEVIIEGIEASGKRKSNSRIDFVKTLKRHPTCSTGRWQLSIPTRSG